ncbi:PilW family protein [Methylomonas sp. 2BW1-5-20]|uniref:PilW family protein n=1 Tax=Methylomonas sp. 2BW1-5-20 TaxID=3376686 RepID=UPI004050DF4A
MKRHSARYAQSGMTLIEIMVALLLGAFLLGGLINIFINAKQTYRMEEDLSRLQESSRFALEVLGKDLRLSGFQGCSSVTSITPVSTITSPTVSAPTTATVLVGYDGSQASPATSTWTPALPATLSGLSSPTITYGTDVISVMYGESCGGYLTADMASSTADVTIPATNSCGISSGDAVMISDCAKADMFRAAANTTSTLIKHTPALPATCTTPPCYTAKAEVFAYRSYSYFIRTGTSGEPSLWRYDNTISTSSTNPLELIEGIENMQILYGEDTDADGVANRYFIAPNVTNMANVVSIRVSLLARTGNNVASQALTYDYNGTTGIIPTDNRIRRVFEATIAVRNRLN